MSVLPYSLSTVALCRRSPSARRSQASILRAADFAVADADSDRARGRDHVGAGEHARVSGHHLLVDLHHAAFDLDAGQRVDKQWSTSGRAQGQRVARDLLNVAGGLRHAVVVELVPGERWRRLVTPTQGG
jgi:hypothetical protein